MSLGAVWSFGRATRLLWFWYGAQRARFKGLGTLGPRGPVPTCNSFILPHYITLENMRCCKVALVQVVRHQNVSHGNIKILPCNVAVIKYEHPNHQDSWMF